jgi:hypothetical protein
MYLSIFTLSDLALLSDWLAETGELYIDIDLPHSGGRSYSFFIHSLADLRALISQQEWPEIAITVFRHKQFPQRGIVDSTFIEQALAQIPDGQPYTILGPQEGYPQPCTWQDDGNNHDALRRELEELKDQWVAVGLDPFERYRPDKAYWKHEEVFHVSVHKNQNYYERYSKTPDNYKWLIDFWNQKE